MINILTGNGGRAGSAPGRACRRERSRSDRRGGELRTSLEQAAAETVKRVYVPAGSPDFTRRPGLARLRAFVEIKTVWHPTGALSLSGGSAY